MFRLGHLPAARRMAPALGALLVAASLLWSAPSALASTPLTGEVLTGAGTASTSTHCVRPIYGSGTFSVPSGTASGPYAGSFSESGSFSFHGSNQPYYLGLSATFTITTPMRTVTGSLVFGYPGAWIIGSPCGTPSVVNLPVSYTAMVDGVTYQGSAKLNLAAGPTASVTETFG